MIKPKFSIRKRMFTVLANGGAPCGHSCPSKTMQFNMIRIIAIIFAFIINMCIILFGKSKYFYQIKPNILHLFPNC